MAQANCDPITTRRRLLAATAALAAYPFSLTAASVAAGAPDPIFAAIDRHALTHDRYSRLLRDQELWESRAQPYRGSAQYRRELAASEAAVNDAVDHDTERLRELVAIEPTSFAGLVALIAHFRCLKRGYVDDVFDYLDVDAVLATIQCVIQKKIGG